MDYEKKYKEALERARKLQENSKGMILKKWLWNIFPELKESKDNRIMKVIRGWIYTRPASFFDNGISKEEILAWLEKQGKQNLIMADSPQLGEQKVMDSSQTCKMKTLMTLDEAIEHCKKKSCDDTACGKEHKQLAEWLTELKGYRGSVAQEAQKPVDKVKPKFHEGDWVVTDKNNVVQIKAIEDSRYVLENTMIFSVCYVDKCWRKWTIQDAGDGDVLFHSDSASNGIFIFKEIIDKGFAKEVICYCDYDSEDHFCLGEHHTCCWTDAKILYPAIKEQRDLLFVKMKEAGYYFDFEKKELKKLGQSGVTKISDKEIGIAEIPFGAKDSELQEAIYYIPKGFHAEIDDDKVVIKKGENPTAWSEEDETRLTNTIIMLKEGASHHFTNFSIVPCVNWLKSLKQRIGG